MSCAVKLQEKPFRTKIMTFLKLWASELLENLPFSLVRLQVAKTFSVSDFCYVYQPLLELRHLK